MRDMKLNDFADAGCETPPNVKYEEVEDHQVILEAEFPYDDLTPYKKQPADKDRAEGQPVDEDQEDDAQPLILGRDELDVVRYASDLMASRGARQGMKKVSSTIF